ncbi:MAG: DUF1097 domain-containing protein [Oscillospiraceae bacterium]|nr:DUF1097 domain-containing protein [Oscillospiraceae bacterium]
MKKISPSLVWLSVSTAILCGVWVALCSGWEMIAPKFYLLSWAGFASCTTYFSCGAHGLTGLRKTLCPNLAGVACGMAIFFLSGLLPAGGTWGVWCGVITFVMCIISHFKLFDFCPGTFMGCFCTFAAGGDWKHLIPSLILGAILGLGCDFGGVWLHMMFGKKS